MLPPYFLFTVSFGGTYIPKLNLIQDLICRDYYYSKAMSDPVLTNFHVNFADRNSMCNSKEVEKAATFFLGVASVIGGLLSMVTSPKFGALSDRYGRKPILCVTASGAVVNEIVTICAATFPDTFPIWWFWVGFALDGLTGTFIVGMAISTAYATDCTPPSRRNTAFSYFYGCLFGGIALGPLFSGKIVAVTGSILLTFYIALGCLLLFILITALLIPESLSKRRQMIAREKHSKEQAAKEIVSLWRAFINFFRFFFGPLKILYPTGEGSSPALRRNLVLLSAIDTCVFGVAMGAMTIITLYIRMQFNWSIDQQSQFATAANVSRVFALVVVLPGLTRLVRGPTSGPGAKAQHQKGCDTLDLTILRFALLLDFLGYVGFTLFRTEELFVLSGVIAACGGMASPTISSSLTKHVSHDRTGQLLGAAGLLHALARVVAPAVFSGIYYSSLGKFDETIFVFVMALFACAFVASWALRTGVSWEEDKTPDSDGDRQA